MWFAETCRARSEQPDGVLTGGIDQGGQHDPVALVSLYQSLALRQLVVGSGLGDATEFHMMIKLIKAVHSGRRYGTKQVNSDLVSGHLYFGDQLISGNALHC